MSLINLNILIDEPADVYHEKAKENFSSHQLITFMRCPYLYAKKRAGLVRDEDSPAYFLGRAAHTRILEGNRAYELQYAIGGPINPATGKPYGNTTKKFLEWQEVQQKPVIPFEKADLIEAMNAGVRMNPVACELLAQGKAEGVIRTKYRDFSCQIRIDWTNPEQGIVDLKTCDDLTWFESDARRFNYVHQLAFYQAVLEQAIGHPVPVYIMGVEKKEPFRCGVWQIPEETLLMACAENEAAMERLREADHTDCFVTGYEELRYLFIN
jgi:hypothetical protein